MIEMLKDWWLQVRAFRANAKEHKAFLALPHVAEDSECVKWTGDQAGFNWEARCPTCNAAPVHWIGPLGGAVHAFADVTAPAQWDEDLRKVTCPICKAIAEQDARR